MIEVGTRFRVLRRLPPSSRVTQPPLMLAHGTLVTIGERSSEWPALYWSHPRRARPDGSPNDCWNESGRRE